MRKGKCGIISDLYNSTSVSARSIVTMFWSTTSPVWGSSCALTEDVEDVDEATRGAPSGIGCWTELLGFWVRRRSWTCCSRACMRLPSSSILSSHRRSIGCLRVTLRRVVASSCGTEDACFVQSCAPARSITDLLWRVNTTHRSHMSVLCVRSHRILSEKQFWHVFDSITGDPSRLTGSYGAGAGGPMDMAAADPSWV